MNKEQFNMIDEPQQDTALVEQAQTQAMIKLDGFDVRAELTAENLSYCSFDPDTQEGKVALYRAMNNSTGKIGEMVNRQIIVKDLFCEAVTVTDQNTGELIMLPRTVLIDMEGNSYQSVSTGIFGAVKRLIRVFGEPTWKDGLKVEIKQVAVKKGTMLTLDVVL